MNPTSPVATFAVALFGLCAVSAPASAQALASPLPAAPTVPIQASAPVPVGAPLAAPATAPVPMSLPELVASFRAAVAPDTAADCLAKAVYFEARGESLEGQLAVAEVVLNRAASGIYPADVCGVITQKAQFSFIRNGAFPTPDEASASWRKALAIANIARQGLARAVSRDVLWYHADYVAPKWGRFHTQAARIGAHIFYN